MGGNINFGSRSEFLPGERSSNDLDIKYERYGGCFVTYKKGFVYLVASLLFTGIVSYLVYYYFSCKHDSKSTNENRDNFIAELLKTAEENEKISFTELSKISTDLTPIYYNLKIQPYFEKKFTFEGQVSIIFQINASPTRLIILNVKDLDISESDSSVTFTTSSKSENAALISESQIKEDNNETEVTAEATENKTTVEINSNTTSSLLIEENTNPTNASDNSASSANTSPALSSTSMPNVSEDMTTSHETTTIVIITESKQNSIDILKQKYNKNDNTYTIRLKHPLEKGINYTLNMKFTGKISNNSGGILRSSYKEGNKTKWLVHTLLKPYYARTVFPCFDEPKHKTKFEIAIARQTNMKSVSNMQIKYTYDVDNMDGWVWDHFEMTPPMSSHSVAFAVFAFNSTKHPRSVPYPSTKLWAKEKNKGMYTLNVTPKLIESYNNFFGYKYSLNKVDLVAIPNLPVASYGSWGILFFRENELMVEDNSSFEEKVHLLNCLSRELAQEWFGNLISVQSWNDSWLTETISNYAHYIGMNAVETSWDIMDETFIFDVQNLLDIDTIDLLPKITSMSANFEKDFDQQLPVVNKASAVMRMLNLSMPELEFTTGIKNFVNKWKYKNFIQNNFWEELNSTKNFPSGIEVKDIINLWITQKGYPLITVTRNKNNSVTIQQINYSEKQKPNINLWILPLEYFASNSTMKTIWLSEKLPKLVDITTANNNWVFFTSQAPCRINYDLDNWQALMSLLKSSPETLSPAHRAQLLDDAFHLARAGLLNYSVVLNMTLYLRENEQHMLPWITALQNFQYINNILSKSTYYGYFEDYLLQLLTPMYNNISSDTSDNYKTVRLKSIIIEWSCKLNYQPCKDWAISLYNTWSTSTNPDTENNIPKDLRSTVYCMGVQNHGRSAWDFLWQRYKNATNIPDESKALIRGMGCATESWILMKYLSKALEEESLDNSVQIWTSMTHELAVNSALNYLKENWSKVFEKYKHSELAFKQILHSVLSKLTSNNDLEQVLELFSKEQYKLNYFAQDMIIIIEKLKQKIDWKKLYMTNITSWIQNTNI